MLSFDARTKAEGVVVLGAEKQAATSLALAYPDRPFVFASDRAVLDGWDLPNVRFVRTAPESAASLVAPFEGRVVPVCGRWAEVARKAGSVRNDLPSFSLGVVLENAKRVLDDRVAGVAPALPNEPGTSWQVKGDAWHRPDFPLAGSPSELAKLPSDDGCGPCFQQRLDVTERMLVTGVRSASGEADLAVLRVLSETHAREEMVNAAETVSDPPLGEATLEALAGMGHVGPFHATWLRTQAGPRLSSLRPTLPALVQTLLRAGLDPLGRLLGVGARKTRIAEPGFRMIAEIHYSEYGDPQA